MHKNFFLCLQFFSHVHAETVAWSWQVEGSGLHHKLSKVQSLLVTSEMYLAKSRIAEWASGLTQSNSSAEETACWKEVSALEEVE